MPLVSSVVIYTRSSVLLITYLRSCCEMLCSKRYHEERKDRRVLVYGKKAPILLSGGAEGEPSA
ncbi:hypothetical protein BWL71_03420 [Salmonella enterica]|uniref:Uncharacterized protein n=1 Tax=Salmonella enterica TaxID=28901 RepID=A0A634F122_SALER|nr:hypothetical protein [Salmonella enterica]EAT8923552.1 hypothetical protein [Salmonella enterica subsp. arizonae serovar 63:z4,z32:-]EBD1257411.1 hypothetical protein [Salmonella enterica subsp. arizonae serovar 62:z4,z32:-]EDX5080398.1 hypothetical protein [Salmonella enterica subsp. arizonae]EAR7071055.1 hypothetical protein [Salmonella enterica]